METPVASRAPDGEVRPLRKDAERNRRRVLEAARELFAEHGLDVTLDDVARRAGVGVGTVYRRFPGKEDLVEALFTEEIDHLVARAEQALEETDPWEAFTGFLVHCTENMARDHGLREVMLSDAYACGRLVRIRDRLVPLAEALVRRAQDAGVLRADFSSTDIPLVQEMIGSIGLLAQRVRPEVWRRGLALVLDGLRSRPGLTPLAEPALTHAELERITGITGPPQ
ncbi:TetR/AcrR family transcriptional regulator [Actinocorallia populi]|uniref:TetR/AcrR family transcriptional regulator n=1 Tax=Actinocorallia populi TaxID=2079200 RepID=UPI0018E512C5|nr:TetR/AcrR family transcriptional regulator [Actinocorallia populi]